MHEIFISLGSNIGDRYNAICSAHKLLSPKIIPVRFSKIYETPPWGFESQASFLNQVIKANTRLSPTKLLEELKAIEAAIGRKPSFKYGPRLIDLDILFYDRLVLKSEKLTIPHPQIANRAFVLVPLLEIAPNFIHPENHQKIKILAALQDTKGIIEYQGQYDK